MPQERRSIPPTAPDANTETRTKTSRAVTHGALAHVQRAACIAKCRALPAANVRKAPSLLRQRVLWMGQVLTLAASDLDRLVKVPLDGGALTRDELREAHDLVEHLRLTHEDFKRAAEPPPSSDALASLPTEALREEIRTHQKTLMQALRLRYRKDRATLAPAQEALDQGNDAGTVAASEQILALCHAPANVAWIADAPRGEGAALARLELLDPAFRERIHARGDRTTPRARRDARDRAWTVASTAVERVRQAGRYLVQGDAQRGRDYLQFDSLRTMRTKAARKAAKKTDPKPADPSPANG